MYGNADGKEGYWSYDHMILQVEDTLDVLVVASGDKYEYVFPFDHSCGHNQMRSDTLNAHSMNIGYGGVGKMMHDSVILEDDGFLGPFEHLVK
eukprot:886481-Ditylum_brightwellii.AAC.1